MPTVAAYREKPFGAKLGEVFAVVSISAPLILTGCFLWSENGATCSRRCFYKS